MACFSLHYFHGLDNEEVPVSRLSGGECLNSLSLQLCSDWSRTKWFKTGLCVFMSRTGWSCGWMMLSGGSSSPSYCWSSCFCGGRLPTTKGKHTEDFIVFLPNPSQLSCSLSSKAASWPHTCALCVGMRSHRLSMTQTMRRLKSSWCLQTSVSHTFLCLYVLSFSP